MNTYLVSYGLLLILIIASYYTSLLILPDDAYFSSKMYKVDTCYQRILIANQRVNITIFKDRYDEYFNSYALENNKRNSHRMLSPITLVIKSSDSGKYFFHKRFYSNKARLIIKENATLFLLSKDSTGIKDELYNIYYNNKKIEVIPMPMKIKKDFTSKKDGELVR